MPATYETAHFMNTILTLYYLEELTQADIAARLGLSVPKVNRMLQDARRQGLVEITIKTPFQHLFDLEARLKAIFGLRDAVVIPPLVEGANSALYPAAFHTLGQAGASFLLDHLRDGDIIAVGGGMAVNSVVEAIEAPRPFDVKVVPVLGATQGRVTTDVNYLASRLAERLGGRVYQLHAPAFADTCEQRDVIENMGPVKEILNIARQATVALLGVGTVDYETSRFVQFTALSPDDMKRIAEDYHGVGEVSAYVYDVAGCPCAPEYAGRVIGLALDELMRVPYRIGVAATTAKALAIYGALRGGFLHALITDEAAAHAVLEHFERDFHKQW